MHFVTGHPMLFNLPGTQPLETIVDISFSPRGNVFAVLTQLRLQFWSGMQHFVCLTALPLPKCALERGSDSGSKLLWHPQSRSVVVSTTNRRLLIFEADVLATNENAVFLSHSGQHFQLNEAGPRACLSSEVSLDFGSITGMCTSTTSILVTTYGGFVVVVSWSSGKVLHALNTGYFLQQSIVSLPTVPISGSITSFSHSVKLQLSVVILSDGTLFVLRNASGNDFSVCSPRFSGTCNNSLQAVCAALNAKHNMIVVASKSCVFHRFMLTGDGTEMTLFEPPATSAGKWCDRVERLGGVGSMVWSPDEESLLVGFHREGMGVFHVSGACTMTTFVRFEHAVDQMSSKRILPNGIAAATWDSEGARVVACELDAKYFVVCGQARRATVADPTEESAGAVVLYDVDSVMLLHLSDAEGIAENWETLRLPAEYVLNNFPIRFCSVSADGVHIVCTGSSGAALYNRKLRRWRLFGDKQQEKEMSCVATPCWAQNLCVIFPSRNNAKRSFELVGYPRFHLDSSSALFAIHLQKRPVFVQCNIRALNDANCILVCLESSNMMTLFEMEIASDSLIAPKVVTARVSTLRTIPLGSPNQSLLQVAVCPLPREPSSMKRSERRMPGLVILRPDHSLCLYDPNSASSVELDKQIHTFWMHFLVRSSNSSMTMLLASGQQGTTLHILTQVVHQQRPSEFPNDSIVRYFPQRFSIPLLEFDAESVPIGVLPLEGFVVSAMEGMVNKFIVPGTFPFFQPNLKPSLYQHRMLLPLFVAQSVPYGAELDQVFGEGLIHKIVHRLREHGCFVDTMDYLLHNVIHDDPVQFDRKRVLRCVLSLLRQYPEYYQVIVGCVRKTDVSKWRIIFDVIGSPLDFFNQCVENNQVIEAVHVIRVILMDRPDDLRGSLEEALNRAQTLFLLVVNSRDFHLAYEIVRFISLLAYESDLPPVSMADAPTTAIEKALRSVWPSTDKPPRQFPRRKYSPQASCFRSIVETEHFKAIHKVLHEHSQMHSALEREAVDMLRCGRISQLCTMFDVFGFDLSYFLTVRWRQVGFDLPKPVSTEDHIGAGSSPNRSHTPSSHKDPPSLTGSLLVESPALSLKNLFDCIHSEFDLPRASSGTLRVSEAVLEAHNRSNEEQFLILQGTSGITETQEHLLVVKDTLHSLASLLKLFTFHGCTEYMAALSLLLLHFGTVRRIASDNVAMKEQIRKLLDDDHNNGYRSLLGEV